MTDVTVKLRPMTEDDLELKVKWANDPVVNEYIGFIENITIDGTRKWFASQSTDPSIDLLTITADDRPIGYAKLIHRPEDNSCEMGGIAIGEPEYWERGIGKIVLRQLFAIAFEQQGRTRFWSTFPSWNDRSIAVHKQVGFRMIGEAPEQRYHPTKKRDFVVYLMEVTRDEYFANR